MAASAQRLLVIDDDPAVGALIGRIARNNGYDTIITDDPNDFLVRVVNWKPAVVAIDLVMPGLDGVEMLRRLSERGCQAQILLISGFDIRVMENASRLGKAYGLKMAGLVRKPFRAADLAKLLKCLETGDPVSSTRLQNALNRNEFHLVYQPKYNISAGRITGLEALARWTDPVHGPIPPSVFIKAAEECGIITELTRWVIGQAIAQQAAWAREGIELNVAMNVSRADLEQHDLPAHFGACCRRHGAAPNSFTFEVTETMAMSDERALSAALSRLRIAGARLAIDDFGTGYSSLVQLLSQPFSELKIDRSFVATCTSSRDSAILVKAVIDLAHNLGLTAVAEGVEDREQAKFLQANGCDVIQGYFVSFPVEIETIPNLMANPPSWPP